ncbi:hypothetical protein D3C72_1517820 [compost metagenome]
MFGGGKKRVPSTGSPWPTRKSAWTPIEGEPAGFSRRTLYSPDMPATEAPWIWGQTGWPFSVRNSSRAAASAL